MMTRRRVLQNLTWLAACQPLAAFAYPISRILGPVQPAYLHEYIERMWTWYNKEFYSFAKAMSEDERQFFLLWKHLVPNWGLDLSRTQMFESFLFSHRGQNEHLNSSRLAVGLTPWPTTAEAKAHALIKKRGALTFHDRPHFYGLGWDYEKGEFKTYYLYRKPQDLVDPELLTWSRQHRGEPWMESRMAAFTYRHGKMVKKKLIVPMIRLEGEHFAKDNPFDIVSAMKIIESGGQVRWHYRLRSFFFPLVNPVVHPALSKHSTEFQQLANSLIFEDYNHYTFYYP